MRAKKVVHLYGRTCTILFHFLSSNSFPQAYRCPSRSLAKQQQLHTIMMTSHANATQTDNSTSIDIEEREGISGSDGPVWDPVTQVYVGKVPGNTAAVTQMIRENEGCLRIFGYGSLCWNPGKPGDSALAHGSVTNTAGQARGYRRAWAQKSTDHRGLPKFPGIVCTLLKDEEFRLHRPADYRSPATKGGVSSLTEGLIYTVPPELVEECLAELDFREKGGYAREIIDVVEDTSGRTVQALLYRGTPDNPAFWPRALRDLPFAAAIMAAATGPSGENYVYLDRLDQFLEHVSSSPAILEKFDDTFKLMSMAKTFREKNYQLSFLCGCGSNQHNQLLLRSDNNASRLVNDAQDAHEMKEIVLCTSRSSRFPYDDYVCDIFAGGGHSGALTRDGRLFLFGWNDSGQLGLCSPLDEAARATLHAKPETPIETSASPLPVISELKGIMVEKAALGFSHTLIIEKGTKRLLAFGDNSRGQVDGTVTTNNNGSTSTKVTDPTTPNGLESERVVDVSAGLFHSTAIAENGDLLTFGCSRFGQSLTSTSRFSSESDDNNGSLGRWNPGDGARITAVACGRRHTVALDDRGRIWTFGDNKYGQLGRRLGPTSSSNDAQPGLVDLGRQSSGGDCFFVCCGWSHTVVLSRDSTTGSVCAFGWGRNDKGQLGTRHQESVLAPMRIFDGGKNSESISIRTVSCGSEFTIVVDESDVMWSCGWNEHGNLSTVNTDDCFQLTKVLGAPVTTTPGYSEDDSKTSLAVAAGGAHVLAMRVVVHPH